MDTQRFRSFAERYVIERASTFKGDTEMEDAWNAVERAKTIYKHIENVADVENAKDMAAQAPSGQGQATSVSAQAVGQLPKHPGKPGSLWNNNGQLASSPAPAIHSQSWTGRKP